MAIISVVDWPQTSNAQYEKEKTLQIEILLSYRKLYCFDDSYVLKQIITFINIVAIITLDCNL